ncbi:MAG: hypothetical protein WBO09_23130 [Methylocystis silviterrae]
MPDIPSHAAQIASISGEPFLVDRFLIIDRPIDASPEPLNSASQVQPIKPMFNAAVQPLTGHQPHGVLSVRENGEPGVGPTSGAAKSGTNPLTCEIIEIADRGEDFLATARGFDPAEHDLEILALIFRARGFDKRAINADGHMVDGLFDFWLLGDFGSRFCFDRFSHCQDTIAGRRVIKTREIWEKFVQDVGRLLIGKLAPKLHLQMPQLRRRAMRKEDGHRRRGGRPTANAGLEARRMNAQMSKHRVDPPPPMFFDGAETPTARTGPNFREEGVNLILRNFRLDPPEQVFAIVMGEPGLFNALCFRLTERDDFSLFMLGSV